MKRAPQAGILLLKICLSLVYALRYSTLLIAAENKQHPVRKLASNNSVGYISIDCGADEDYIDGNTSISYQSDASFVSTGENHVTSSDYSFEGPFLKKLLNSLRSFPDGTKNCYTLRPKEGKNNRYQITALFAYGNYDSKDEIPEFDVYLGVNYWDTIDLDASDDSYLLDAFFVAAHDSVDFCLVNTDSGTPIISLLELRLFRDSIYETPSNSLPLDLMERMNLGSFEYGGGDFVRLRYTDDIYNRIWSVNKNFTGEIPLNTSAAFTIDGIKDDYKLPRAVLSSAVHAINLSSSLDIYEEDYDLYEYIVYLHFFEFVEQAQNLKKRIMDIAFNGQSILPEPLTLGFWKPRTIVHSVKLEGNNDDIHISITATPESDLPAMLNAYEIYRILPQPDANTAQEDADAMCDIKRIYEIPRISWRGDPCVPKYSKWEGLDCSSDYIPRVTSLNLSSSSLKGEIAASFSNLTKLNSLDLSNNELTGHIPEFLAELPDLHFLNLARNKLTGSIPKALKEKANTTLLLSLDGNPGLCQTDSCTSEKHKSAVRIFVIVAGAIVFLMIIVIFSSAMIWRLRRKVPKAVNKLSHFSNFNKRRQSKEQQFTYAEMQRITNNFERVLGKGGFGVVYHGYLGNTQVAVKVLSYSVQGYLQFQGEVELLTTIHHKRLITLIGYCDEGTNLALIYEYMANGDLAEHLSDKSEHIIGWKQRLQIAIHAAEGLEYLHNGCKPPIIHRDVKSRNILLNEQFYGKLSDFGLSKILADEDDTHIYTMVAGTPGYLDPEYSRSNKLTEKSDVYSFGVVLLEIITGQLVISKTEERIHIVKWVESMLPSRDYNNIVDLRLQGEYDINSATKALDIAMMCVAPSSTNRPTMSFVVRELKQYLPMEMVAPSDLLQSPSCYSINISFDRISGESSLAR